MPFVQHDAEQMCAGSNQHGAYPLGRLARRPPRFDHQHNTVQMTGQPQRRSGLTGRRQVDDDQVEFASQFLNQTLQRRRTKDAGMAANRSAAHQQRKIVDSRRL